MTLDDEVSGTGLDIVPESYGMDVPCTIVIVAGEIDQDKYYCFKRPPLVR